MHQPNPYQSPETESYAMVPERSDGAHAPGLPIASKDPSPAVSTDNTVLPRHIAALMDNAIALLLCVVAAKSVAEDMPVVQLLISVTVYLGYYFVFESLVSRTPGKLLTGLVVIQFDGRRCTWRQTLIRTCIRVLEANPVVLGALPAAICILSSKHHQRFGDKVARTIVVPARRLRKRS
jgi:uncharacterized RDD family membrane protein YckC